MKVLSLFDGISCARVALERVGIPVDVYYASEIDKYAIQITQKNHPNTIQVGSVVDLKGEVLHLSVVYDMLKEYDSDIQNKLSKQEMLYWLNEDFSISAKIGTQIKNADSPESASLQRIEEIWFSRSGVGDIIKTQKLIGSRVVGENGNTQTQELLLQCGEWGYVYRSHARDTQENIGRFDRKKTKTRKHREDTPVSNQTVQQSEISPETIRDNKDSNVEAREQKKISDRIKEQKEWGAETAGNRKEYARSKVQGVSFPLQTKDDNEAITEREWLQLSVRKEMETTMVKTSNSIDIFLGKFEIMCGGSPCQDLSIAKKNRKGLDGERSSLFWEYVRILKEVKPKYFILENVASMPKEAKEIITKALGVEPIMINASLVSAQNRKRLFWTNIPNVGLPEDKGILLKDILENGEVDRDKSFCIDANYWKGGSLKNYLEKKKRQIVLRQSESRLMVKIGSIGKDSMGSRVYSPKGKSKTLSANGGNWGAKTGLYCISSKQAHATISEDKSTPLVSAMGMGGGHIPMIVKNKTNYMYRGKVFKKRPSCIFEDMFKNAEPFTNSIIRKLTPVECERLQGLPDNYTDGVSNTQRYKMLGNAFNCDVVAWILSFIPKDK